MEEDTESDVERRPNRYKPRAASALLNDWDFSLIRPEIQHLMLVRDGADFRDGAAMRVFNMHLILAAASTAMNKETCKRFRKAVLASNADKNDV